MLILAKVINLGSIFGYGDVTNEEEQYGKQVGIHAPKRKGKTLTMIMCLRYFLEEFDFIEGVISNLRLTLPEEFDTNVVPLRDIKMIGKDKYRNYILALDEIGHIMESRMSSSFRNIFVSNLLADTGKFKQLLLYTSQDAGQVDKRVRNNVDRILRPDINFKTGQMEVKIVENYNSYFNMDAYNIWDKYNVSIYFPFRQFYSWYDTSAKIDEYVITYTPKDHLEMFMEWYEEEEFSGQSLNITNGTLNLWKEEKGIIITKSQISALMEYMRRKTDLPMRGRKTE